MSQPFNRAATFPGAAPLAVCVTAGLLLVVAACTGDSPEEKRVGAEPLTFDSKPLWATGQNQAAEHSGLEAVYDIELVGDYLVLAGYDKDGDLNDHGYDTGAIVVLDADTGKRVWTASSTLPLPDDKDVKVKIGHLAQVHAIDYDDQRAIAIDSGVNVAVLAVDSGKLLTHERVVKESENIFFQSVEDVSGDYALANVRDDDDVSEARMLNLATGKTLWSRDKASFVGGNSEAVVLEVPSKDNTDESFEVLDPASGKKLWDSHDIDKFVELRSVSTDVVIADTMKGSGRSTAFDIETGKHLDVAAGSNMATPGVVADLSDGLAVTYTGDLGAEVKTISVHKVED